MARIESQFESLLARATKRNALIEGRLRSGRLRPDDFDRFVGFSLEAMELGGELSGFFIGLEANGECVGVSTLAGRPSIWRSRKNPARGTYEVEQFWPADYPRHPFASDPEKPAPDIRTRPWYVQARRARRPVWTDVSSSWVSRARKMFTD